ncbi:Crp/Fnr family transcriptional regulator [Mangrovibacterium diazotrophicum]|uniref:Transcriptional regulator n=1 Tax=Mangrovibacterium diazotrophicum TaxID=1261403 RepID=A0A419WAH5_9BACT|nr:Crp/Fnr family transcriptional regulator [Mangrovibacterium diazotrophicum]RKD92453.1 transcriptional regulator [Mangrovibacterium diazotrophicum]
MLNFELLVKSPVFMGLDAAKLEDILDGIHYQIRKFDKNEQVVHSGDPCVDLMLVLSGSVKGEMADYNGKTIKIEDIPAPRPLAAAFLFGQNNRFPVNVIANEEVSLLCISRPEFLKILQKDQRILTNYLNSISSRAQFLSSRIKFLSFKTIRQKIAHYLLDLAGDRLAVVELPLSQAQLAEFFGVTRPALARAMGEMAAEGLMEVQRRTIRILDKGKMNDLLNG